MSGNKIMVRTLDLNKDFKFISLFISGKNLSNSLSKFHFILDALGLKLG